MLPAHTRIFPGRLERPVGGPGRGGDRRQREGGREGEKDHGPKGVRPSLKPPVGLPVPLRVPEPTEDQGLGSPGPLRLPARPCDWARHLVPIVLPPVGPAQRHRPQLQRVLARLLLRVPKPLRHPLRPLVFRPRVVVGRGRRQTPRERGGPRRSRVATETTLPRPCSPSPTRSSDLFLPLPLLRTPLTPCPDGCTPTESRPLVFPFASILRVGFRGRGRFPRLPAPLLLPRVD